MKKQRARVAGAKASITASPGRLDLVDAARGVAIAMMIAYHFCFDLTYFGWARWPMLVDPRWIAWRSAIVTCFLLLVGVSLALRDARSPSAGWFDRAFVRRWLQIAVATALVTAGSAMLFPASFIYFGVLHFVAVALWACRRASRAPVFALIAGPLAIAVGILVGDAAFDPKWIDWIGFAAHKPVTEDYVPLFPWLGVVLIGCGLGGFWARHDLRRWPATDRLWNATPRWPRVVLAGAGRWSLTIYLVHQPLLLGAMTLVKQVF